MSLTFNDLLNVNTVPVMLRESIGNAPLRVIFVTVVSSSEPSCAGHQPAPVTRQPSRPPNCKRTTTLEAFA